MPVIRVVCLANSKKLNHRGFAGKDRYISNLEQGVRQPAPRALQAIAGALDIEPKDLFEGVPPTHKPLDADLTALASLLKDASPADRARAIDVVRSLVKPRKSRK